MTLAHIQRNSFFLDTGCAPPYLCGNIKPDLL